MTVSIAHLGPAGTNAEVAAMIYATWLQQETGQDPRLCTCPSILQSLRAVIAGAADLAVVPVENSIEGSVTVTLDTLWQLDSLRIQKALVLPIENALISQAPDLEHIRIVYSHPQALAQCQLWLETHLPAAQPMPTRSTTEALKHLEDDPTVAAIASQRAAQLYNLPVLVSPINDHPDNCTRFWALSLQPSPGGEHTSVAFTLHDVPGALIQPLQVFAHRHINLSKIESRPSKKSLGDYLFFVDLEADQNQPEVQAALEEVAACTQTLKIFGSYDILPPQPHPQ